MDSQDKEIAELKGFIAELKTDRTATKEKEKREAWTKYTSMSMVFIAVLTAIATQRAAKYSGATLVLLNKATFQQAQASDKWSYYQASSIKQNLYETLHETAVKEGSGTPVEIAKREELFKTKIKKYTDNKEATYKEAKDLESLRDEAQTKADASSKRGANMGVAASTFQISIAMGSICLVTKKKWLWYLSLGLAALATYQMIVVWMEG